MKLNIRNSAIVAAATIFAFTLAVTQVHGRHLTVDNDRQPGIYSERSWNNNEESENIQRNTWLIDPNEDESPDNVECAKGGVGTCGERQSVVRIPIKKESPPSDGWGAGGMPFNILYMKPPKSAKTLRSQYSSPRLSATYGIAAEPLRSQPLSGPQAQRQYQSPEGLDEPLNGRDSETTPKSMNLLNGRPNPKGRSTHGSLFIPSRRHYSIIPQLFVSYGWGPIV